MSAARKTGKVSRCDLAYAIACLSWIPTLMLAWKAGYFRPRLPKNFDKSVERAQRVPSASALRALVFGVAATAAALALAAAGGC
jgi:multisubunit Na+/H+ antiporter MnhC subunit